MGERLGLQAVAVEVLEDATERGALDDERDDAQRSAAEGAEQRLDLVDLADELRPGETPSLIAQPLLSERLPFPEVPAARRVAGRLLHRGAFLSRDVVDRAAQAQAHVTSGSGWDSPGAGRHTGACASAVRPRVGLAMGRPDAPGVRLRSRGPRRACCARWGGGVLACPRCGGRLRLIAVIDESAVTQRILRHLGLPTEVPEARPARARHPSATATRRRSPYYVMPDDQAMGHDAVGSREGGGVPPTRLHGPCEGQCALDQPVALLQ